MDSVSTHRHYLYAAIVAAALAVADAQAVPHSLRYPQAEVQQPSQALSVKEQVDQILREHDLLPENDFRGMETLLLRAREIDPSNTFIRQRLEYVQARIADEGDKLGKEARWIRLQTFIRQALAENNEVKLNEAIRQLESELKVAPENKEFAESKQLIEEKLKTLASRQKAQLAKEHAEAALKSENRREMETALAEVKESLAEVGSNRDLETLKGELEQSIGDSKKILFLLIVALVLLLAALIVGIYFLFFKKRKGLLEFADGDRTGEVFPLEEATANIGALEENHVVVADNIGKISRTHCQILREGRRYFITDTSRNGTWVNNQRLDPGRPKLLRKGDVVSLAGQATFIFRLK